MYGFVHGNFALANSADGHHCGVDSEMQVLAETGCYADFTLPPGLYHRAHIAKINSLYECSDHCIVGERIAADVGSRPDALRECFR